jgi:hypothetical protein
MRTLSRRDFGKKTLLLSCVTALGLPASAAAFFDKMQKDTFLQRDDLEHALKSYYMTYDSTTPYPHKFNEVLTKQQLRSLQFHLDHGADRDYVAHYIRIMTPALQRISQLVQQEGAEQGLREMFEGTPSSYQLFERIDIAEGQRTFPCPYNELLGYCKQYLPTFTMEWKDVCGKWCTPVWTGFAAKIGFELLVQPGETCTVKVAAAHTQ